MEYFSNLAIEKEEQAVFEDHSYPAPEIQLQWRIEDLFNRLEELQHGDTIKKHLTIATAGFQELILSMPCRNTFPTWTIS